MDKKVKDLNFSELQFKPIDLSFYNDKIKNISIDYNDLQDEKISIPKFNFNVTSSFPKFIRNKSNIDINIDLKDEDHFEDNKICDFFEVVNNNKISNIDSHIYQMRKSYLKESNNKNSNNFDNIIDNNEFKL